MRLIVLGTLLYVAGSAIFYMMPPYLAFIGGRLALDAGQLGTLAAAESAALALASLAGPFWIGRIDRRILLGVGALACVLGNLGCAFAGSFGAIVAWRVVVGFLGEGVLYTVSFAVLGTARNVDRAFGVALSVAVIYGALVTAGTAGLTALFPAVGPLAGLVAIAAVVFPSLGRFPAFAASAQAGTRAGAAGRAIGVVLLGLVAQAIWYGAPGAFWTFVEQVATDKGVPTDVAELAVSVGEMAGLAGGVAAALQGSRWGRLVPLVGATFGMIVSAILYGFSSAAAALSLFLAIFYSFWNYGTVYQMAFLSELDSSGKAAVMMPAAQVFGLSFGPYVAGQLMVRHGDGAVTQSTIAFALSGLALFLVCFARVRRRVATA